MPICLEISRILIFIPNSHLYFRTEYFCMHEWNCHKFYLVVQQQYNALYLYQLCCTTGVYQDFYVRMEYIGTATSCIFNRTAVHCSVFIPGMLLYNTDMYQVPVCCYCCITYRLVLLLICCDCCTLLLLHAAVDILYWCCSV